MTAADCLIEPASGMKRKASTCPHCGEPTGRCFEHCTAIRVSNPSEETRPMTASPLYQLAEHTPEEAAKVAEFEAAPTPTEVLREQLITALYDVRWPTGEPKLKMARTHVGDLADAALAVFRGQQDPAVQRVLAVHRRFVDSYGITHDWCAHDPNDSWPCPTVAAIVGALSVTP